MGDLTERQRAILQYISDSIDGRGYPPTLREIGDQLGIKSTNGVNDHLRSLVRKGYLAREGNKARSLRILRNPDGSERRAAGPARPIGACTDVTRMIQNMPVGDRRIINVPSREPKSVDGLTPRCRVLVILEDVEYCNDAGEVITTLRREHNISHRQQMSKKR